ncbi:MAG: methyl-accepting chemotaxis protein [Proteobacteria bacterium]|nr:methyl-accepting chemotaxis protein [Pseudomonadota bacterium]
MLNTESENNGAAEATSSEQTGASAPTNTGPGGKGTAASQVHLESFQQMVEQMPVNVVICELENFTITYANESTKTTLKQLEHLLPIKADDLLGSCIDVFHQNPEHQRRILSDPRNLPHHAQIKVGDEILDLLVTAIRDGKGNYTAAMLTWSVITQKVKADAESARLMQMVEQMPVNVLTLDLEDFTINYANKASIDTLKTLEHLLPVKADDVVGACVDVFHKNPEHQRAILKDPSKLPYNAQIEVGDEILDLLVSPIHDKDGKYIAPMLTWSVVTQKVKADAESARLMQMVEQMPINVLTLDLEDFTINYANKASIETLKTLEHLLPVKADDVVGACVDVFHKNPEHQRRILKDPRNLPHTAQIEVGDEILDLLVSPIHDKEGNYIAPMLTWSVVTAKVKADAEAAQLMQMVEQMPINVLTLDLEDFTINYANKASLATLREIQHLLPVKPDEVVGACVDVFHKNPEHQRRILRDPSNLPHEANIEVGDETLALKISAINDKAGNYIAPMLTWEVITEQVTIATKVKEVVNSVAAAATEMESTSQALSSNAEQTSRQASVVAAASEEASTNVQTVASATEELSSSIKEIGEQVAKSASIAGKAVEETERTNVTVQGLADAAQKIGDVVSLINDIASQTNLLALNATIEAARAGDAGKGFAVVASEVKILANQTAKATEEIAAQIGTMQTVTNEAVGAIGGISTTIQEINEIANSISAAVEEQDAATQEITRNVQQAADGTQEVNTNITGVNEAATQTGAAAQQLLEASGGLAKEGEQLSIEVDKFLTNLGVAS